MLNGYGEGACLIITQLLDKYLVIDADTFFLKPTKFIENGKCLYNYGTEYEMPYFIHMKKLNKNKVIKGKVIKIPVITNHEDIANNKDKENVVEKLKVSGAIKLAFIKNIFFIILI